MDVHVGEIINFTLRVLIAHDTVRVVRFAPEI